MPLRTFHEYSRKGLSPSFILRRNEKEAVFDEKENWLKEKKVSEREHVSLDSSPESDRDSIRPDGSKPAQNMEDIFRSFGVSIDDPCEKVLSVAFRKYGIKSDPSLYDLYIVTGDLETNLSSKARPLRIFKEHDTKGLRPFFMLREKSPKLSELPEHDVF